MSMAHPSPRIIAQKSKSSANSREVKPSLEWLIHPAGKSEFFQSYFEKKPLVVKRNEPEYFRNLLSLDEIDRVLTTLNRSTDEIILKNARRETNAEDYTVDGDLDVARVCQLFGEGSTITLAFLDTVVPQLTQFCRCLEKEFSCPFQTNIYLTPPNAQGAKAHYDTHDVFVLQISGTKKWVIYGTPVELPLPGQDFDSEKHALGEVTQEFTLEAGDVAYVPRGVVHDARSTDTTSLHITAGVLRYTWTDLLLEFLASASLRDTEFRKSLPPEFTREAFDRTQARENLLRLLKRAAEAGDFDGALEHFADDFISKSRPVLRGQMAQVAALERISAKSIAGVRPEAMFRMHASADGLHVDCYGRRISFPAQAADAVRFALHNERFAVDDLPGELGEEEKIVVVRRLVKEGLAVVSEY
ncbi:MAG TPA: cupin domain-containing protein [Candidatus Acidoferrales bacterium]|nr:cupin domain-containing protein [Candidatus Acidoferrales bacterium]